MELIQILIALVNNVYFHDNKKSLAATKLKKTNHKLYKTDHK